MAFTTQGDGRWSDAGSGARGIACFVVDAQRAGFHREPALALSEMLLEGIAALQRPSTPENPEA